MLFRSKAGAVDLRARRTEFRDPLGAPRMSLKSDVRPVTEFRARTAALLNQVRRTQRPLLLTVNGRSRAVLMDVEDYERLTYERDLLRDGAGREVMVR